MFINYVFGEMGVHSYRNPSSLVCADIVDFVGSILDGFKRLSVDLDGALDAVNDGSLWHDLCTRFSNEEVQDILESIDWAVNN